MSVKVIYYSRKGHTKLIADAIGEVCGVEAINIAEPHSLGETDLLFVGMGVYAGKADQSLLDYLDNLPANMIKGAAVFSTSASTRDRCEMVVNILEHKGITVYPKHLCLKGQFLFFNLKHPDENDILKAQAFAQEVLQSFQG